MEPKRIFYCVLILFFGVDGSPPYDTRPRSPLCVKNNAPCSSDGLCTMFYFPANSSACSNLTFANEKTPVKHLTLGQLRLNTYLYQDRTYFQTAYNISFSNITWDQVKFRISQNGIPGKNTCRQFKRFQNSSTTSISYDCVWSDERYEGKTFILEYEAQSNNSIVESSSFQFVVPLASGITREEIKENWRLGVYVETIPTRLGRTIFNLFWPPLPTDMETVCYRVFAYYNESDEEKMTNFKDVCNCNDNLCSYTTQMWYGTIRFGVQPLFEHAVEGFVTKTQYFELGGDTARPLLLSIVCCSILVPIILYLLLLLRNRLVQRAARAMPPKVLVIYSPSTTPHLHVVESLVHYLNTHCHVIAWMDELDIPNTTSKDPFVWCAEAIEQADMVCVVASPFFGQIRTSSALYRTDRLLLHLLRERYARGGKTRYCVLLPSYTTAADIPMEAMHLRKLNISTDLDKFLQLSRFRWPLPGCLAPAVPGGTTDLPTMGRELLDSMINASADLRENREQYIKQALLQNDENQMTEKGKMREDDVKKSPDFEKASDFQPFRLERSSKELVDETYSDYSGNLDNLNLLGDKEEVVIVPSSRNVKMTIDLDDLVL